MTTRDSLPAKDGQEQSWNREVPVDEQPDSVLDVLYDMLVEMGNAEGVEKLAPGVYRVAGGWF